MDPWCDGAFLRNPDPYLSTRVQARSEAKRRHHPILADRTQPFALGLFFSGEITCIWSKRDARELLESEGFRTRSVDFSWRTAFIHMVVAASAE